MKKEKKITPVHPGKILMADFLEPLNMSQTKLAKALKVSPRRVNEIVLLKRRITADTALRLSIFFGTTPNWWLDLQSQYELDLVRLKKEKRLRETIRSLVPITTQA